MFIENLMSTKPRKRVSGLRKSRSDKHTQIKINVTLEEKKFIYQLARLNKKNITYMTTALVIRSLNYKNNEEWYEKIQMWKYPSTENMVSCHLPQQYIEQIDRLSAKWICSRKKAAWRILIFELGGRF